ncbi:MAG: RNA 2',3'-cyclic phosphodiesterase [Candidatus Nanoarchaeia archaeon]
MSTKRCFVAIDLPEEIKTYSLKIQEEMKKQNFVDAKYTDKENIHLTLKFLGEITASEQKNVSEKLKKLRFETFSVELGEAGVFSDQEIRIIWLSLKGKGLHELQKKIDDALNEKYPSEFRFMAHITIARVKNVRKKQELLDYLKKLKVPQIKTEITEFSLKSSELASSGPVYNDIERFSAKL